MELTQKCIHIKHGDLRCIFILEGRGDLCQLAHLCMLSLKTREGKYNLSVGIKDRMGNRSRSPYRHLGKVSDVRGRRRK